MAPDSATPPPRRRRRLAATVALALLPTSSTFTLPRHHHGPPRRLPVVAVAAPDAPPSSPASSTGPTSHGGGGGQLDQASSRLYRARLRLAEAQGRIPPGVADEAAAVKAAAVEGRVEEGDDTAASTRTMPVNLDVDDVDVMLRDLVESNIEVSRIREYNFTRVAQAEYEYDPSAAEARLFRQVRLVTNDRCPCRLHPCSGRLHAVFTPLHAPPPTPPPPLVCTQLAFGPSPRAHLRPLKRSHPQPKTLGGTVAAAALAQAQRRAGVEDGRLRRQRGARHPAGRRAATAVRRHS